MAKKALLDVLEKTIGKYVLNLDAESLNVAVWSGTIELNALELNVAAVNAELDRQAAEAPNLALPFRVVSGRFESFHVDVPWSSLTSKSVVLRAQGLAVEMEPHDRASSADFLSSTLRSDESESARTLKIYEHRALSLRLADDYRLQANLLRKLAEQDLASASPTTTSKSSSSAPTGDSFGARLVRRIIENVQIEIRDVRVALRGADGAAGFTLDTLQLVTTDSRGARTFVDRTVATKDEDKSFLYKSLAIAGLGAYLDESVGVRGRRHDSLKLPSIRETASGSSSHDQGDDIINDHSYVLAPLSFEATLRQSDSNQCLDHPKYLLQSHVRNLSILLSKTQLEVWQKIMAQIQPALDAPRPLFPEYRPASRVRSSASAREWWRYAGRCIGRLNGRRLWREFFYAFQKRKTYIPLYKRHRHSDPCSWLIPLSDDEISALLDIENDRSISVEGIMTWRNIADAQVEKEKEKDDAKKAAAAPKSSLFTALFGSSSAQQNVDNNDEPPVSLTVEEMKALETITMEQVADSELSTDSKLADVKFVLGSLDVTLSTHEVNRQLAVLDMGTVSTSFNVNADGSFLFDFSLRSLEIVDRATPQTLYPSILKNQVRSSLSDLRNEAFRVHVAKTKSGDQHLQILLNTFEAVASPSLLQALKRFLSSSPVAYPSRPSSLNPLLAQSMSGSVDLFYDATEGTVPKEIGVGVADAGDLPSLPSPHGGQDLPKALIEAWKVKTETKAAWVVDLDIHAPVLVLPENCVDPRANVVVFDLGQLRVLYGKPETAGRVQQWCKDHPRARSTSGADSTPVLDSGSIAISNLTFVVGKNNYWQRLVRKNSSLDSLSSGEDTTVFEPASLSIDFGIESSKSDPIPRVCLFGTVPLISLKLSPPQLTRIKRVVDAWRDIVSSLSPNPGPLNESLEQKEVVNDLHSKSSSRARGLTLLEEARRGSAMIAAHGPSVSEPTTLVFVDLRLQRLSLAVASDDGSGLEAHLVSAALSFESISDSSSVGRLSMGWFWVVDRLKHDRPRRQRYVIHSRLPKSPDELTMDESYDAIHDLQNQGVFEPDYRGSRELADITYKQRGSGSPSLTHDDESSFQSLKGHGADTTIDARFSSLRVNWNPAAVKTILSALNQYAALLDDNVSTEVGNIILSSPEQLRPRHVEQPHDDIEDTNSLSPLSLTRVTAVMEKLEVSLNSALDDLPLFLLSMSSANLLLTTASDNIELDMSLDDLRIETPICSRTDPLYRTVLGLSPGRNESLLKIQYVTGDEALSTMEKDGVRVGELEAFAKISVSPMRLVYIQAQVLALVEYSTEGILGALTAQAASSAAAAARELAAAECGRQKLFVIEASGLQALLPEAALSRNYISVTTGTAVIEYISLPDPGGGRASISLKGVVLSDSADASMQESPIGMNLSVSLPPEGVGSPDDQAMRIGIEISEAPLMLSKRQYAQILRSLAKNIGEPDLCLREGNDQPRLTISEDHDSLSMDVPFLPGFTHSGAAQVESQRRMYIDVVSASLSLLLCNEGPDDPIIRVDALKAKVSLQQFPVEGRMKAMISLSDLTCADERIKAIGRQHRMLVYQASNNQAKTESEDLFTIDYESTASNSSTMELTVGSPRVVFIPDAVSEVLSFVAVVGEQQSSNGITDDRSKQRDSGNDSVPATEFAVETSFADDEQVETTYVKRQVNVMTSMAFHLVTSRCSLILVDLGSNSILPSSVRPTKIAALSESIVFGGEFEARYSSCTQIRTGRTVSTDAEFHGKHMEVFTAFGLTLDSPMQILEPTQLTLHLTSRIEAEGNRDTMDIRAATLTPLDLALSMRNVALANAIISSVFESFDSDTSTEAEQKGPKILDDDQTREIERLARALDSADETSLSSHGNAGEGTSNEYIASPSDFVARTTSVKVTLPEATITIINDLQGLDEALLRVTTRSSILNGQLREGERMKSSPTKFTAFDFMAHSSVLADFYDESKNRWRPLLLETWEVSTKAARAESCRFTSPRPSTTIDVESFPCSMSFSEQFLMSIASANRMWSVYTTATTSVIESDVPRDGRKRRDSVAMSLAASAARTLTTSLPYAIENHTGVDIAFVVHGENESEFICGTGTVEYFRFSPPKGAGSGGRRVYGQDLNYKKAVTLCVGSSEYCIDDLDAAVGNPRQAHVWDENVAIVSIVKEEKTVTVYVSSGVDVRNFSSVPVTVGLNREGESSDLGTCSNFRRSQSIALHGGKASKLSARFGVPFDAMRQCWIDWKAIGKCIVPLIFNPTITDLPAGWKLEGSLNLSLERARFQNRLSLVEEHDVECRAVCSRTAPTATRPQGLDPFVFLAIVSIELVGGRYPAIDVTIKPRAILENSLPVSLSVRTPMPHTYSEIHVNETGKETVHYIGPKGVIEIFTPGPSVAVSMRCAESPVAGTPTDWMSGWVDLPLVPQFRIPEALQCEFPFVRTTPDPLSLSGSSGCEFFIANGESILMESEDDRRRGPSRPTKHSEGDGVGIEVSAPPDRERDEWRNFIVTVYNYGVDHLGDLLFEQVESSIGASFRRSNTDIDAHRASIQPARQVSPATGAFSSSTHPGRVSLLPSTHKLIRLLHLTMEGDDGIKRSQPFCVDDVSICDGGVDSTPLLWEDGAASGFYAYRNLISTYQSAVHVVPEYVVFNGSKSHVLRVKQPGGIEVEIRPGRTAPLRTNSRETATIAVVYEDLDACTSPLRVDSLGLRIAVVKTSDGKPLGSLAMQTIVGSKDSRLVVKLGELKLGALSTTERVQKSSWLEKDFLRFRIQWTELRVTLDEGRPIAGAKQAFFESAMDRIREAASPQDTERHRGLVPNRSPASETWVDARNRRAAELKLEADGDYNPVCTIVFSRFTIDWQRVFKDEEPTQIRSTRDALRSPERSQLSIIVHNVQLRDEMPNSPFPVVFDSTSEVSFFDLCIRCRGPLDSELVKVDLFDLNLAHENGVSQRIIVSTSEEFVWRLLDLANRIVVAAGELAGVDMELKWDEEQEGYAVAFRDKESTHTNTGVQYTPPSSDRLYDIALARVSPFTTVVSFKRTPQSSRYKLIKGVRGSHIMNYFTKRLKFKINQAELKFARYEAQNIKGPPDRLLELLSTVYMSRAKLKFVTIMTATSFQDWKALSSRDEGDDAFVEGDILRATGNIAGNTANYILRHAGRGIGQGVSNVTSTLGDGIENVTGALGVRVLGAGVNSVVTGVGDGVSSTISGVGSGAGKVLLGAGQGAGAVFGGLTGGALMIGKGVGRAITTGDGRAAVAGVSDGVSSLGAGVGQGIESVVSGTTEGVLSVGQGLFSGVKSVGKGISGAFRDCCSCCIGEDEPVRDGVFTLTTPLLSTPNSNTREAVDEE